MEAKKKEGVSTCPVLPEGQRARGPEGCCVIIEWTDATSAAATSMGDWKKGGQWGEWALLAVR